MTVNPRDADRLARNVLRNRLHLRPNENVTIEAYPTAIPWAAGFVREARRAGARPVVHYEDEGSYWTAVEEGSASLIGAPGKHEWAALSDTDVYIYFWGPEDLGRRSRLSEKTQEATTAYNSHWYEVAQKAGLRGARMMMGRVTEPNARLWGVKTGPWQKEVLEASLRSPTSYRRSAERVRRLLEKGDSVRLRHPNGTDLTLALAHRPAQFSLGDVPPKAKRGRFGMMANVPDGTVYVAVDETSADGSFVANRTTTGFGPMQRGGRFTFRDGRLRRFSFASGGSVFRDEFRAAGAGKDRPAFLEVGLDPSIRNAPMLEEMERGAVTVGVGRNAAFGGKTDVNFFGYLTVGGAELSIDGEVLTRGGRIVGA